jgi:diguanylate cyclase (GGDEF)-like protein/PAS domain S-box-containing protein
VSERSRFVDSKSGRTRPGWTLGRWFASKPDPLLETLFERASDGFLVCAADGKVLSCNPAASQLIGDDADAIEGHHVAELFDQGSAERRFSLRSGSAKLRGRDGSSRPVLLHLTEYAASGVPHVLVRVRDASERNEAQERLKQLANYDSLTGLPNRVLFRDRLGQAMARAKRHGQPMALMFLDLDRFKIVNDELGHEAGDLLLQHVAKTLSSCLRAADSVARDDALLHTLSRLGGDEFTLIVENVGSAEDAAHVARRMLEALGEPFVIGEEELVVTASIGISIYPTDDVDLDTLIRHTDMAMYRSKSLGRATYSFFSEDLSAAVTARVSLEGSLRRAVEREEFLLHFQPKADLRSGKITGVEALVRWQRPGHGLVPPDRFVSVLEDTGLILPVGAWVIRAACEQLSAWDRLGLPPLNLAVNLSARQFRHLYLASMIEDSLRQNGIDPQRLEIELTESLLMEDNESTRAMLESFRRLGVRLAIDDFGTGHSSLSYIRRFAIDTLKIDRSFVQSLPDNSEDSAICSAVIALGRNMKMCVVAEGVETQEQAQVLRELGCDEVQGWWISRPMPGADFASWYTTYSRTRARRKRSRRAYSDTSPITLFSLLDNG